MERTDNTLPAASGDEPARVSLEPFQAATDKARSFYKTNLNFPLSFASPDVLTALLKQQGKDFSPGTMKTVFHCPKIQHKRKKPRAEIAVESPRETAAKPASSSRAPGLLQGGFMPRQD